MNGLKLFGKRDPGRQTAEIHIRIPIMNRFSALGRTELEAAAWSSAGKGKLTPQRD